MKTRTFLLLTLFFILPLTAPAQNNERTLPDFSRDSLDKDIFVFDEKNGFAVQLNGMNVQFKKKDNGPERRALVFVNYAELGFNTMVNTSYNMYPASMEGFFDLRTGKSTTFSLGMVGVVLPLSRVHKMSLRINIGFTARDYTFDRNITIRTINDMVMPVSLERDYKKSKLNTFAWSIPIDFTYKTRSRFMFTAGAYADFVTASHTKVKFPKEKHRSTYKLNVFQPGVKLKVGYRGFYVFGSYGLMPIFKDGKGPKMHPMTFGIGF